MLKNKYEIKTFSDKEKMRRYFTGMLVLKKIIMDIFETEGE